MKKFLFILGCVIAAPVLFILIPYSIGGLLESIYHHLKEIADNNRLAVGWVCLLLLLAFAIICYLLGELYDDLFDDTKLFDSDLYKDSDYEKR